jgi:hypothetical protein
MATHPATETLPLVTRSLHLPITSDPEAFGNMARESERVLCNLAEPGPQHRGKLALFILTAVENELTRLDAAPAGWRAGEALEDKIGDQLYRMRLLGYGGLALCLPSLSGIADEEGKLGTEDSDVLRHLFQIAERERLHLFLPPRAGALRVVGAPQPLSEWLTAAWRTGPASIEYEAADSTPTEPQVAPRDFELMPPPIAAFTTPVPAATIARDDRMLESEDPSEDEPSLETPAPAPVVHSEPLAEDPHHLRRCAAWAAQLENMTGPKVHGSIERAFLTAYLPLSREVMAGKAPAPTAAAAEKWAEGFAQSYAAAYKSLHLRAKRPKMVKDVVELGVRWLSHYRAPQCQLLLVDGMRFDLGQRVNEHIERRLGGRAQCVDQTILWAALPSNSESQQIGDQRQSPSRRLIEGRKAEAAAEPGVESVRFGSREVFRLNRLTAELARPGEAEPARLERLAASIAEDVVPWVERQPPETLVVIFGDHGFHWQSEERGTSAARCGGALPEQVLVPASAWLVGEASKRAGVAAGVH